MSIFTPQVETGPLGSIIMILLLVVLGIGLLTLTGLTAFLIYAGIAVVLAVALYYILLRLNDRLRGYTRGGGGNK